MPGQTVKQIEVSDSTFERLQKLAKPLVDTSDSVVTFLVDYYEKDKFSSAIESKRLQYHTKSFECGDAPNLTHTKVVNAKINGTTWAPPITAFLARPEGAKAVAGIMRAAVTAFLHESHKR